MAANKTTTRPGKFGMIEVHHEELGLLGWTRQYTEERNRRTNDAGIRSGLYTVTRWSGSISRPTAKRLGLTYNQSEKMDLRSEAAAKRFILQLHGLV